MAGIATQQPADDAGFRQLVDAHERAVRLHCYRMLGSLEDAEDLTQETFLRAWRGLDAFEGRAAHRTWLYRIATHVCLDELQRRRRRVLPSMLGTPRSAFVPGHEIPSEIPWLDPFPDAWLEVPDTEPGPEARYEAKETIELAFVAALQRLAPRQRAVLILRDVLGWSARDVGELLETSVEACNSALQRARARLDASAAPRFVRPTLEAERALVERYVRAWEQRDVATLVSMLRHDATLSMPPLAEWYSGVAAIAEFLHWATSPAGPGPYRLLPTRANGSVAFGIYAQGAPLILQVLALDGERIAAITSYMNPELFKPFSLPLSL